MDNIAVFAANHRQFENWARDNEITDVRYVHVQSEEDIRGREFKSVTHLWGWKQMKHYDEIYDELLKRVRK